MTANIAFELADKNTEGQFRQLLRDNPLAGNIHVLLTREPDAFQAAAVSGDVFELMLAYRESPRHLIGGCARFEFDAFINGRPRSVGYLGELRMQGGAAAASARAHRGLPPDSPPAPSGQRALLPDDHHCGQSLDAATARARSR